MKKECDALVAELDRLREAIQTAVDRNKVWELDHAEEILRAALISMDGSAATIPAIGTEVEVNGVRGLVVARRELSILVQFSDRRCEVAYKWTVV